LKHKAISAKSIALFIVKLSIAALLIYWLLKQKRLDLTPLLDIRLDIRNISLLLTGCIGVFIGLILLGIRLRLLLRYQNFNISNKMALDYTMLGSFFGAILPGLVGGDAVKAVYICSSVPERRMDAFSAVMIDRMFGLFSLFLLASIAGFFGMITQSIPFNSKVLWISPMLVVIIFAFVLFFRSELIFNTNWFQYLLNRIPLKLKRLLVSLRSYLKSPKLLLIVITISLLNHSCVIISFLVMGMIIDDPLPLFSHFIVNPIAMSINMIPLTPGGIGLTESAFAFLYQAGGSSNGALIGLSGRMLQYAVFVIGGLYAFFSLRVKDRIELIEESEELI